MADTFILGTASNYTISSARLAVNQGVIPADFLEERYYLFDSYYNGTEPTRDPDAIASGSATYVDFINLPSGRMFFVQAWRRYTDTGKAHLMAAQISGYTCTAVLTLMDTVTINPAIQTYTPDLTTLSEFRTQWNNRVFPIRCMNDGVMGDFIRWDVTSGAQGWLQYPKRFNTKKPIVMKSRVRFSTVGNIPPWWAAGLYSSEAEDATMSHAVGGSTFKYTFNLPWFNTTVSMLDKPYYDIEVSYDGVGVITYKVDDVVVGTLAKVWHSDPFVYFGATAEGVSGTAYFDVTNIEVTGEEVGGFVDASTYLWDTSSASSMSGTEWQNGYPSDGSNHFHQQGGGFTNSISSSTYVNLDGMKVWMSRDQLAFHAGTATITSPKYLLTDRIRYNSLRLIGSTRSGGTLKTWIKKADGSLVSDSEVPYNSFGFTPEYGIEKVIDLRAVTATSIYFYTEIYNPTQGVIDYNLYSSQSGPPILKQLSVDFYVDPITPLEFIPRILTAQGYRPGRVYLKGADGFRRVNAEVLT